MEEKYPTKLTKDSRYHLVIGTGGGSTMEMEGEFVGYLQYGSDVALTMRLGSGSLRVVPSRSIIYLDILDSKEEKDERPKENGVYFG
jgi:hypothetical protein